MKRILSLAALMLAFGLTSLDADAAKRFGGGGNTGKQRATPTQKEATPAQPASPAPNQAAAPAGAAGAAGAAAAAKPSFMQRWGGLLAGLGIGMLLASLFGAQMGPIIGMILMGLLVAGAIFLAMRFFANRNAAAASPAAPGTRPQYAGIGSQVRQDPTMNFEAKTPPSGSSAGVGGTPEVVPATYAKPLLPADTEPTAFLRVAKATFMRLQAANDSQDFSEIRGYLTPELFTEVSSGMKGEPGQKTEVVSLEAVLVDCAVEDGYDIASVRFYGLIRETPGANPESFDEIWHVQRKAGSKKDAWLISGIQQNQ